MDEQGKSPKRTPSARLNSVGRSFARFDWRRLAPYTLGLGVALLVLAGGYYFVRRLFDGYVYAGLVVGVVALLVSALLDPARVQRWLGSRQARYGSNVVLMSLAFFGIVVVLNFLSYRHNTRWDLTENKQFTLAPETLQTLATLPEPAEARAFYTARTGTTRDDMQRLLAQYEEAGAGKFTFRMIDPEADPAAATADNITRDATVVMAIADRSEALSYPTEEELTAALVRLANPGSRKVYFLTGHGEADPAAVEDTSMRKAVDMLSAQNYTVGTLNLLVEKTIPNDTLALVIAGPDKPLAAAEVETISAYLAKGGGLVALIEPTLMTHFAGAPDTLAAYLQAEWGVTLYDDVVVDTTSQNAFNAIAAQYAESPIVEKLFRTVTIFPTARGIALHMPEGKNFTQTALVLTGAGSWGETDLASIQSQKVAFDAASDHPGPAVLAAAIEQTTPRTRLVIFGDSDFGRNVNFDAYGNGDMLVNAINWAAQQDSLINLTPKTQTSRIVTPPSTVVINLIMLGTICLLPGAFVAAGVGVWISRRRHK